MTWVSKRDLLQATRTMTWACQRWGPKSNKVSDMLEDQGDEYQYINILQPQVYHQERVIFAFKYWGIHVMAMV